MLQRILFLLLLILTVFNVEARPNCYANCTFIGYRGSYNLDVDGRCARKTGNDCQVNVNFQYHTGLYDVTFDTSYVSTYSRFIYILPSNYLTYTATFACSSSEKCAVEFAQKKLVDLGNRTYNSFRVSQEVAPFLNEARPSGSFLRCYDGEVCLGDGVCQIEYDTKGNSQRTRGCNRPSPSVPPRVSVYDSGSYTSFDIECNRTNCNSPDTMAKVKAILASHNLTDADGRINGSSSFTASMMIVAMMLVFSKFFNWITVLSLLYQPRTKYRCSSNDEYDYWNRDFHSSLIESGWSIHDSSAISSARGRITIKFT